MTRKLKIRLCLAAALAATGAIVCCAFIGKMHERTEFVGKMDPNSGYRCRFTISSNWHNEVNASPDYPNMIDHDMFIAPTNPMGQWIECHLLHHGMADPPLIHLNTYPGRWVSDLIVFQNGYPEPSPLPNHQPVPHRHRWIDGFPATIEDDDFTIPNGILYHSVCLYVYVPNHAILYTVLATAGPLGSEDRRQIEQIDHEMEAIIASFHVEKVAPAGGKR
jgi:hypothetical protein